MNKKVALDPRLDTMTKDSHEAARLAQFVLDFWLLVIDSSKNFEGHEPPEWVFVVGLKMIRMGYHK